MSTVAMRSGGGAARFRGERSRRGLAWWAAVLVGVGLLALLVAWLLGWFRVTTDPRVQEVLQLQEEAMQKFTANGGPQTIAEATEAVAAMNTIRQKVESLPEPLREQVQQSGGSMFRSMMRAQINAYFDAPPENRREVLDRQIRQEETMRKAFEAARAVGSAFGVGGPPGGNPERGGAAPAAAGAAVGSQQAATPASADERRNVWMKRILDTTTPEQRARYVEYRRVKEVRRSQLGLPSNPWGR